MENGNYWRGNFCLEVSPTPDILVIFGASGDLARRKLLPAIYNLFRRELLHGDSHIVGCARHDYDTASFRELLRGVLPPAEPEQLEAFLQRIHYLRGDYGDPESYRQLGAKLEELGKLDAAMPLNYTFYLATPSSLYLTIVPQLSAAGLLKEDFEGTPWRHVVMEKPFGRDTASAQELDLELHRYLKERQIYRIDHYLGKETVQNILMLRFANIIFEPIWNQHYIAKVEITAAEEIGIGRRAGYFESAGLLRDMFQNHMLEMLSMVAMEMPGEFSADAIRDEKLKLLRAIRPFPQKNLETVLVRGQYAAAGDLVGYRQEEGVAAGSTTETFVAAKLLIDNWRWRGVPFFLRSGKRLKRRLSEIAITFKAVPHSIFQPIRAQDMTPDTLVLSVQPEEGMSLTIQAKQPGPKLCMGGLMMHFNYAELAGGESFEAYERLLLDAMLGDQTLFIRSDIIAASWRLFTPVLEAWRNPECCPLELYPAGSSGPSGADRLTEWREL